MNLLAAASDIGLSGMIRIPRIFTNRKINIMVVKHTVPTVIKTSP